MEAGTSAVIDADTGETDGPTAEDICAAVFDAFDTIGDEIYVVASATGTAAGTTPEVTYAGDSDTDGGDEPDDIDTTGEVTCAVPSTTGPNDTTGGVTCEDGTDAGTTEDVTCAVSDADIVADTTADGACARVCDAVTAGEVICVTSAASIDVVTLGDEKYVASDGDTAYSLASSSDMGTAGTIVDDTCDTAFATETVAGTT